MLAGTKQAKLLVDLPKSDTAGLDVRESFGSRADSILNGLRSQPVQAWNGTGESFCLSVGYAVMSLMCLISHMISYYRM